MTYAPNLESSNTFYIYCIQNLVGGKRYIGSSIAYKTRWNVHARDLIKGVHYNDHLQRAWNKYGEANFSFDVIETNYGPDEFCKEREDWWMAKYDTLNENNGFNMKPANLKNSKFKPEISRKISIAMLNNPKITKPIVQYDLTTGKFLKEWISASDASRGLIGTNRHQSRISACCRGDQKSCVGYGWSFKSMFNDKKTLKNYSPPKKRPLHQKSKIKRISLDGKETIEFNSITEAARDLGYPRQTLGRAVAFWRIRKKNISRIQMELRMIVDQDRGETFPEDETKPRTGLYARLKKLFSNDVVIRNIGNKKLKIIDSDSIFRGSDKNSLRDRYNRIRSTTALSNRDMNMSYQASRLELFRDYDCMDQDPIIASALDIYSEESTTKNELGEIIQIQTDDENIKQILRNLFYDILNVEFNLYSWTRNLVKYGDQFLKLEISPEYGIYGVTPCSAYEMNRIENSDPNNPGYVKFQHEGAYAGGEYENYEIAHFRLVGDSNFLPYGKSQIEGARRVWKQLQLMIDGMLIHRVMRAPERRIFKMDIGNIPPSDVDTYMEKVVAKIKKVPYIDERTGDYNLRFNLQNMIEDFYLPIRGGDSGTSIETLPGMEFTGIEDIEFLSNRMMAALRIPKQFLAFDDAMGGRATLSAEDVRFSRTISRIQQILLSELRKIATIHLFVQGFQDASLVNFELTLTNPSTIQEQEKIALWADKIALSKDMMEGKMMSRKWIYENIFNFSLDDARNLQKEIVDDAKFYYRLSQIESDGNDPATSGKHVKDGESSESNMDFGASFAGGGADTGEGEEGTDDFGEANSGEESGNERTPSDTGDLSENIGIEEEHHGNSDTDVEIDQRKKDAKVKKKEIKKRGGVEDVLGKLDANKYRGTRSLPRGFSPSLTSDLAALKEKLGLGVPKATLLREADIKEYVADNTPSFMDENNIMEE